MDKYHKPTRGQPIQKRPLLAAFGWSLCLTLGLSIPESASAAEVYHKKIDDDAELIIVSGDITSNDEEKFRELSIRYKKAIVGLNSAGGALFPAIEIGKMIRLAGYPTMIVERAVCASSCALIWLAGSTRFLSPEGRVGFHAAYRDNSGKMEESGVANAVVGRYLTLLNLPEKAIIFATMASPDKISWLTKSNREEAGIDFANLGPSENAPEDSTLKPGMVTPLVSVTPVHSMPKPAAPQPQPVTTLSSSKIGEKWLQFAKDRPGTTYYYDVNSIIRSGSVARVWQMNDHSRDHTVNHRTTIVHANYNCSDKTFYDISYIFYDRKGNPIERETISESRQKFEPLAPGSVGMALWEELCVPKDFQYDNPNDGWIFEGPATTQPRK